MEHFSLDGYDVQELLGFGATGEVWRAVEVGSGDVVALKRLHGSFDPLVGQVALSADAEQLRREAALLASVQHEHLVRLRCVVPTSSGLVLVLDFAEGGSLAALLAGRGRLTAGEVVTVGAPLAQALAEVHARGLLHGDVTPANIVFTADGKPLLTDLGVASLSGERARPRGGTPGYADPSIAGLTSAQGRSTVADRGADVYGLAATCFAALCGRAPNLAGEAHRPSLASLAPAAAPDLVAAIEGGLVAEPRLRPDAAAFAHALFAACAPEPVRLLGAPVQGAVLAPELTHRVAAPASDAVASDVPTDDGTGLRGRVQGRRGQLLGARRLLARRLGVAAAGLALVGTAILGGVGWASHSSPALAREAGTDRASPAVAAAVSAEPSAAGSSVGSVPNRSAEPATGVAELRSVLALLDGRRDRAFVDADGGELDAVYVAASPALTTERATLARLVAAGQHARDLAIRLVSVAVKARAAGRATLLVTDVLPAYSIVGPGDAVTAVPGRGQRSWLVELASAPSNAAAGGWLIASVTAQ